MKKKSLPKRFGNKLKRKSNEQYNNSLHNNCERNFACLFIIQRKENQINTAINTIQKKLASTAILYLNQPDLIYYEKQLDLCKQNGARMKLVLNYRKNNYTYKYIAFKFGVSQPRIQQIEHKAIARIKAYKRWQTEEETNQSIVFPKYIKVRAKRKLNKPKIQPYDEMIKDKIKQYKR
jgi:hypothetical protein